jgi:hypothetical protein
LVEIEGESPGELQKQFRQSSEQFFSEKREAISVPTLSPGDECRRSQSWKFSDGENGNEALRLPFHRKSDFAKFRELFVRQTVPEEPAVALPSPGRIGRQR